MRPDPCQNYIVKVSDLIDTGLSSRSRAFSLVRPAISESKEGSLGFFLRRVCLDIDSRFLSQMRNSHLNQRFGAERISYDSRGLLLKYSELDVLDI